MRIQYSMKNGVVLPTVESSDGCRCIYWYNINPNPNPSAKKQPQFRVLWDSNTIHDSCTVVRMIFSYDVHTRVCVIIVKRYGHCPMRFKYYSRLLYCCTYDILIVKRYGMIQKSELKKTLKMEIEEYPFFVLKGQGRIGKPPQRSMQ